MRDFGTHRKKLHQILYLAHYHVFLLNFQFYNQQILSRHLIKGGNLPGGNFTGEGAGEYSGHLYYRHGNMLLLLSLVLVLSYHVNFSPFGIGYQMFSRKKAVCKNSANFTGKHLCQSLFLINLLAFRLPNLLQKDSSKGVLM